MALRRLAIIGGNYIGRCRVGARGYCQNHVASETQHPSDSSDRNYVLFFVSGALVAFVFNRWWLAPHEERFKKDLKSAEEAIASMTGTKTK